MIEAYLQLDDKNIMGGKAQLPCLPMVGHTFVFWVMNQRVTGKVVDIEWEIVDVNDVDITVVLESEDDE